ncbi:MAG: DUF4271 domain-containing protein [Cytophagaceae bacterium]
MRFPIFLIGFLFFFSGAMNAFAVEKDVIVAELHNSWFHYDHDNSITPDIGNSSDYKFQYINGSRHGVFDLSFNASPQLSVFLDQQLIYKNTSGQWEEVKLPLRDFIGHNTTKALLAVHDPSMKFSPYFYISKPSPYNFSEPETGNNYFTRDKRPFQDLTLLVFFAILTMVAVVRSRYPRRFREYISLKNLFVVPDDLDSGLRGAGFSFWVLLLINVLIFYLLFLFMHTFSGKEMVFLTNWEIDTFWGFSKLAGFLLLLLFLKFVYLQIVGGVFKVGTVIQAQYLEFIKILSLGNFLVLMGLIFSNSSKIFRIEISYIYFFYVFLIIMLFFLVKSVFLIFKYSSFRNFYLFSYLCVSEILPLFVIIKILINNLKFISLNISFFL